MVQTPVGIKCRNCARQPRSARVTLRPDRAGKAMLAAAGSGTAAGVVLAYAGYLGYGFFSLIVAFVVGLLVGRATLRASGYYRAGTTGWIAAAGAGWAYVMAGIVIAYQVGGSPGTYVQGLGLLVAGFFAYREAT
jgi:hypothetical protein